MSETVSIRLVDGENMHFAGSSLARTIYEFPLTILLRGELGAGKTTFIQGFAQGLGIETPVTSPTFALEQHHVFFRRGKELNFLHVDCYRLSPRDSEELLASTDDHLGIRCVEWSDRREVPFDGLFILIDICENSNVRTAEVQFSDVVLPSYEQICEWRLHVMLPPHIQEHCDTVGRFSEKIAKHLLLRGRLVRPLLLRRAGELHDLLRFVDFKPQAMPDDFQDSLQEIACWKEWKRRYANMRHEEACGEFLREQGFFGCADIVQAHGDQFFTTPDLTIEQKILFYADKRVKIGDVVSLEERFADLEKRYPDFMLKKGEQWWHSAQEVEKELFEERMPF
ncbi:tRNA (adenosine(37)-N6)-threonylcarbamoyltransferase complex ATPase subunit type 1 TsaE [Candidatus Peribacteria bacterium RIFCSPHIGHO2_02_FULL_49_16]|nr:MAG: tRNA (adenosine(37)-N6)-threonylcarbamoyltransferase complex ATPase subunit type 1 TsaE [Candidatus Peribacteria bacterium RIFCSPHIGHO2_01_FULL_49_38]OGJ58962.1 MAG: tRNA (adenosine(37)-N6)-threonylcarbamoyltransferase complex ATPase subunit type 1 TsaE [Candidatus Peribacteria bacterium RIFCSPHIGHO2_02_FULL_49_16]